MTALLAVRHNVADYAAWREVYDSAEPIRARHGCSAKAVYSAPGNDTDVFVTHEFPDVAAAQGFAADPELAAKMQASGVTGAPRFEFFELL